MYHLKEESPVCVGNFSLCADSYNEHVLILADTMQEILNNTNPVLLSLSFRYQLRVRYFPKDLKELYTRDKVTFFYLFDQVNEDELYIIKLII